MLRVFSKGSILILRFQANECNYRALFILN
jgi:hypothetical protein